MKADKKELNERLAKLSAQVQETVSSAEFMATTSSLNSEVTQKLLDLRSEVFTRIADFNAQTMEVVGQKAN